MKYFISIIIWLCALYYPLISIESHAIDYTSWLITEFDNISDWIDEWNQVQWDNYWSWWWSIWSVGQNSLESIAFWDIVIEEIFPSSGDCLDEHIIIVAHKDFSWYIDILGAWVSSWIVRVRIDVYSWEQVVIADNIAGIKTTNQIILLPSITLTNWWEFLQLRYSWYLLDSVVYSDPRAPKSLVFSEYSSSIRYFKTIQYSQLQIYCDATEVIATPFVVTWSCPVEMYNLRYNGSGYYTLFFRIPILSCNEVASSKRLKWSDTIDVNVCQTFIEVSPWVHHIQFYWYSQTWMLVCSNELYFASQYDVWYIHAQNNSPWQCQNIQKQSHQNTQPTTFYESKNCGIEIQSPKMWFTVNSSLNVRVLLDELWLTDSQNSYACVVDFGNGDRIDECNPSSYRYKLPWIYTLWIHIKDRRTGQSICSHSSFLYIPPSFTVDVIDDVYIHSWFNCSWTTSWLYLDSVLPNPKWSDSWQEQIVLYALSWEYDVSEFMLKIWKRNFDINWPIVWQKIIMKDSFWLLNKWMCFDMVHTYCWTTQRVCYGIAKDDDTFYCPFGDQNTICILSTSSWDNQTDLVSTNSCVEKINKLKHDHKSALLSLREKQKKAIASLRIDQKELLQLYRNKERVARNSRYLRERSFRLLLVNPIISDTPFLLYAKDIQTIANTLTFLIEKKYYSLIKGAKTTTYAYDIKKYISQFITPDPILFQIFPDLYEQLIYYQVSMQNR